MASQVRDRGIIYVPVSLLSDPQRVYYRTDVASESTPRVAADCAPSMTHRFSRRCRASSPSTLTSSLSNPNPPRTNAGFRYQRARAGQGMFYYSPLVTHRIARNCLCAGDAHGQRRRGFPDNSSHPRVPLFLEVITQGAGRFDCFSTILFMRATYMHHAHVVADLTLSPPPKPHSPPSRAAPLASRRRARPLRRASRPW